MGRPKKPMAMKLFDGTYKECLHGDKDSVPKPDGQPVKPDCVASDSTADAFWDRYVPQLIAIRVATALDEPALEDLCMTYSLMVEARTLCQCDPTDKDSRIAYSSYSKQWEGLAKEFGMTPVARERIKAEGSKGDDLDQKFG